MRERSTDKPLGCCLNTALLPVADGAAASQFHAGLFSTLKIYP
jgi:hypothetical protein